ncbi:MAG: glycosyltransferase [Elusimicrobia bacterium]|nr:glycosyltransferase [Elusimicrobiota bacterium]
MNPEKGLTFSVIIPCYNQGRFLMDALESLAVQTRIPDEVVVVNGGSDDAETNGLCHALPHFHFPFRLKIIIQGNFGVGADRNAGIKHSAGEVIVTLDADDKLPVDALETFERLLLKNPLVDIISLDIQRFGLAKNRHIYMPFNPWLMLQVNLLDPFVIRRKVFEAGHWYDEKYPRDIPAEDWEFGIRACVLGPFLPMQSSVCRFYRKHGYSLWSYSPWEKEYGHIREFMHRYLAAKKLLGDESEMRMRTLHAPTHIWARSDPKAPFENISDIRVIDIKKLKTSLEKDHISRFVWLGDFGRAGLPQLMLNAQNKTFCDGEAAILVFVDEQGQHAQGVMLDRLAILRLTDHGSAGSDGFVSPDVSVRQIFLAPSTASWRTKVVTYDALHPNLKNKVKVWLEPVRHSACLPKNMICDERVRQAVGYYFKRPISVNIFGRHNTVQTLVIVMRWLHVTGADYSVRTLLERGDLRSRFERIIILTLEESQHDAQDFFRPFVDDIVHLGHLWRDRQAKNDAVFGILKTLQPDCILLSHASEIFDLLSKLKRAMPALRIVAQAHCFWPELSKTIYTGGGPKMIAKCANVLDRVAAHSRILTTRMIEELYFPRSKIKTVFHGVDQRRFDPRLHQSRRNPKTVLWCARMDWQKDPLLALRVAIDFLRRRPEKRAVFKFAGDGPGRPAFEKELRRLQVSEPEIAQKISYIGLTHKVDKLLQKSSVIYLTSRYEGVPLFVIEAMSCGIPVVAPTENSFIEEMEPYGWLHKVADRQDIGTYICGIDMALELEIPIVESPPKELGAERYAREMTEWLFGDMPVINKMGSAEYGKKHQYQAGLQQRP